MPITAASLVAKVSADTTAFNAGMSQVEGRLGKTAASLSSAGATATRFLTLPLVAVGGAAVKMSLDFDNSMSKINSLVGVSAQQMGVYRKSILDLGGETTQKPKQLADALYFITSSGFKGQKALDILRMSAKAASAGLGDTKTVADLVTSAINAYGEGNLTAARATDVLVAAVREGKAEPEEMAQALGRVLSPAQQAGVSFDQVAGAVASLSLVGLDANEGVTALRGTLMSVAKPTAASRDMMKELGTSIGEVRQNIREKGLLAALEDLATRSKGNAEATATLFGNVRALNGVLALTGANYDKVAGVMERVAAASGDTNEAFSKAMEDNKNKIQQAISAIQVALIQLGGILAPIVTDIATFIATIATKFGDLEPSTQKLILAFAGIVAAIGPALSILGAVGRAVMLATGPFGLLIGGLLLLSGGFKRTADGSIDFAGTMQAMASKVQGMIEALRPVVSFLTSDLGQTFAAAAIGALVVFKVVNAFIALKAAALAARAAMLALGLSNPFGALFLGIGLLAGVFAKELIPGLDNSRNHFSTTADAANSLATAVRNADAAMRTLGQATLDVSSAELNLQRTKVELTAAQHKHNAAVDAHGPKSKAALAAGIELSRAEINHKQSKLDLTNATVRQTESQQKHTESIRATGEPLRKLDGEYKKITSGIDSVIPKQSSLNKQYQDKALTEYIPRLQNLSNRYAEVARTSADPKLRQYAAHQAFNSQANEEFIKVHKRLPVKTEMKFIQQNYPEFKKNLDDLPIVAKAKGDAAAKGLDLGLAPMPAKAGAKAREGATAVGNTAGAFSAGGFGAGQAGGQGIVSGLMSMIGAVQSAAGQLAAASVAAMPRAVRAGSPSRDTHELVGVPLGQGIVTGMEAMIPKVIQTSHKLAYGTIAAMQNAVRAHSESQETREKVGIPLAQGLIEGFKDHLVSGGEEIKKATEKAMKMATTVGPAFAAAARALGLGHAKAIVAGFLQGSPDLAQQIRKGLQDATRIAALETAAAKIIGQKQAQAIVEGFKEKEPGIVEQHRIAFKQAEKIKGIIEASAKLLGKGHAEAIARGITEGSPGIVTQVRLAMNEARKEMKESARQAVTDARDALSSGFANLATSALGAFDKAWSGWKSETRTLLETMQVEEQVKQLQDAINQATPALNEANAKLAEAVAGGDPEQIKSAQAGVLSAQNSLNQAVRAQQVYNLEQVAKAEEEAHAKRIEKKRGQFEKELEQLRTAMAAHPKEHKYWQGEINKLLAENIPGYSKSGANLGLEFAKGIRSAIGEVKKAFHELLVAVRKMGKLKSNAEEGPLSDIETWWTGLVPGLIKGVDLSQLKGLGNSIAGALKGGVGEIAFELPGMTAAPVETTEPLLGTQRSFSVEMAKISAERVAELGLIESNAASLELSRQTSDYNLRLANQQTFTQNTLNQWKAFNANLLLLFKSYEKKWSDAGWRVGILLAQGMRDALGEVEAAARELAKAIKDNLATSSPTKKGPMSDLDQWWKPLGATLLSAVSKGGLVDGIQGMIGTPRGGGAPITAPGSGGGGTTIQVNMPGATILGNDREAAARLADILVPEIRRRVAF